MARIEDIDKNFKTIQIPESGFDIYDAEEKPFKIYGVFREGDKFRRMNEKAALTVSERVHDLHANTAGGRVKFVTDSKYIAIKTKQSSIAKMGHMALCGSTGFDVYCKYDGKYYFEGSFQPSFDIEDGFESMIETSRNFKREITVNFPLYTDVNKLYIGLQKGAFLGEAPGYKGGKTVYYGSSITQGGCASRPGMAYQAIISRRFDRDFINLGFSGNAKGEKEIYDYIANLDMDTFVYDYDHNAPSAEHLKNTHEKMFKEIRKRNPLIPIVIMSRPKYYLTDDEVKRMNIIKQTYQNAVESGDKNVYFLSGPELMGDTVLDEGTVDDCHPTDLGFFAMAKKLGDLLEKIYNK